MRISQSPIWLTVAWSAVLKTVAGWNISWVDEDFVDSGTGTNAAVISADTTSSRTFHWKWDNTSASIKEVYFMADGKVVSSASNVPSTGAITSSTLVQSFIPPAQLTTTALGSLSRALSGSEIGSGSTQRPDVSSGNGLITIKATPPNPGSVTIVDLSRLGNLYGRKMWFEVLFASPADLKSVSRFFTVIIGNSNFTLLSNDPVYTTPIPYEISVSSSPQSNASSSTTGSASGALGSPLPTSMSGSSLDSSSGGSGGGISPGVIAGIVVGVVIALLLIGALLWWLLRRGGNNKAGTSSFSAAMAYGGPTRNRTQEIMAEKEVNAGLDPSPHSPYSDDGGPTSSSNGAVTGAAIASVGAGILAHQHQYQQPLTTTTTTTTAAAAAAQAYHPHNTQSFSPYSDHPSSSPVVAVATVPLRSPSARISQHSASQAAADDTAVGRSSLAMGSSSSPTSAGGGRTTPLTGTANAPTPYVHLVEEGMTADDIRRLEEEERELDQAIERAGRGVS